MNDQIIKFETLQIARKAMLNFPRDPINYTQTFVQKWLREKRSIHIVVSPVVIDFRVFYKCEILMNEFDINVAGYVNEFVTYEAALESGICVGLEYVIKNKK